MAFENHRFVGECLDKPFELLRENIHRLANRSQ